MRQNSRFHMQPFTYLSINPRFYLLVLGLKRKGAILRAAGKQSRVQGQTFFSSIPLFHRGKSIARTGSPLFNCKPYLCRLDLRVVRTQFHPATAERKLANLVFPIVSRESSKSSFQPWLQWEHQQLACVCQPLVRIPHERTLAALIRPKKGAKVDRVQSQPAIVLYWPPVQIEQRSEIVWSCEGYTHHCLISVDRRIISIFRLLSNLRTRTVNQSTGYHHLLVAQPQWPWSRIELRKIAAIVFHWVCLQHFYCRW